MDKRYKIVNEMMEFAVRHPELGPWNVETRLERSGGLEVKFLNGHKKPAKD